MFIRVCVFLLYCFVIALLGCDSKSEVTRQSASPPQASPSPQQPAANASGQASNVQPETASGAETGSASATTDACTLLTKSEIEEVQGEPVRDTKSSSRSSSSLAISHCFYTLATFNKSVSLELTRSNTTGTNQPTPKDFWKNTFHVKADKKAGDKEGGKEADKPRPVPGVGDEAFWTGNPKAGALYVLKNNAFIRISLGGADDESVKINKAKALAQKALGRF